MGFTRQGARVKHRSDANPPALLLPQKNNNILVNTTIRKEDTFCKSKIKMHYLKIIIFARNAKK